MLDALLVGDSKAQGAPKRVGGLVDQRIPKKPAVVLGKPFTKGYCSKYLCHLAGAVTSSGAPYASCEQFIGCAKFSHVPVTRANKESVASVLTSLEMFKKNRTLREKCEQYLATT